MTPDGRTDDGLAGEPQWLPPVVVASLTVALAAIDATPATPMHASAARRDAGSSGSRIAAARLHRATPMPNV